MRKNTHSVRSLIAFFVTWAFIILTITGIVLYVVPQGRIAYWIHWRIFGLERENWANLHMVFGALFIATGIYHLYFNWKPFKKYLADRIAGHLQIKRELLISLIVTLVIAVGAVAELPPVSWVFNLNRAAKTAWVSGPEMEPPFGHAEELSLPALARRTRMDLETARSALKDQGIVLEKPGDSLERIARSNNTTPMELWGMIQNLQESPKMETAGAEELTETDIEVRFGGTGIGRKRLAEICRENGLDEELARQRLAVADMAIDADESLKDAAERYELSPIDLLKIIMIQRD